MMYDSVTQAVGSTPLIKLGKLAESAAASVYVKLESLNPCGSVKDRVGIALIEDAEQRGEIEPGATLVEPTSGNTGIALAFAAAAKGYRLVLTMPERMSKERIALLRFLGATVELTPGALMAGAVERAEQLVAQTPGAVMLQQFENPANPEVHRKTTAEEIWRDTEGAVDVFVAGVGTGGTITGVGEVLKERKKSVRVVAVEPAAAAVLSGKPPGQHYLMGLGAGFIPKVLNVDIIDEIVPVKESTALDYQRRLAREEGICVGISSGAAVAAALHVAKRKELAGKMVVTVACDTGERYVTSMLYNELSGQFGG